jgi:hypothetical protein
MKSCERLQRKGCKTTVKAFLWAFFFLVWCERHENGTLGGLTSGQAMEVQLLQLITQTMAADNTLRPQAEAQLNEALKNTPDPILLGLCNLVKSNQVPYAVC